MVNDYIINNVSINNIPNEILEQGFDDLLKDLDDPIVFSHFVKKFNVTEGVSVVNHGDVGYQVPCVSVYFDYNTWCSWSDEMKGYWFTEVHPELHKIEKNEWGTDSINLKLSDEEVNNVIIPMEDLEVRFPNV